MGLYKSYWSDSVWKTMYSIAYGCKLVNTNVLFVFLIGEAG